MQGGGAWLIALVGSSVLAVGPSISGNSALAASRPFPMATPNAEVRAIATDPENPGRVFVGGAFDVLGPPVGFGTAYDGRTAQPMAHYPRINGRIFSAADDRRGGWFVFGTFTRVAGQVREGFAHLRRNGALDPHWRPSRHALRIRRPESVELLAAGARVYVATEAGIRVLNSRRGRVNRRFRSPVRGPVVPLLAKSRLYLGDRNRAKVLVVDSRTGSRDRTFRSEIGVTRGSDGRIDAMEAHRGRLYVSGEFERVGGAERRNLAAVDLDTGTADRHFNAEIPRDVTFRARALAATGHRLYVAGDFENLGTGKPNGLGAVSTETGQLDRSWRPKIASACGPGRGTPFVTVMKEAVVIGGCFERVDGLRRSGLAKLDPESGRLIRSWRPEIAFLGFSPVFRSSNDAVFVGAEFPVSTGTPLRNGMARIDLDSPGPSAPFFSDTGDIALAGSRVYAARSTSATRVARESSSVAAFDAESLDLLPQFRPLPDNLVSEVAAALPWVYLSGAFREMGGVSVPGLARVNGDTGAVDPDWIPQLAPGAGVGELLLAGSRLYVAERFPMPAGGLRTSTRIRAFDALSGAEDPTWSAPTISGRSIALAASSDRLFVGGVALDTGTGPQLLLAFDVRTGKVDPGFHMDSSAGQQAVTALAVRGPEVYAVTRDTPMAEVTRRGSFAIEPLDGRTGAALGAPLARLDGEIHAIEPTQGGLLVGGEFLDVDNMLAPNLTFVPVSGAG